MATDVDAGVIVLVLVVAAVLLLLLGVLVVTMLLDGVPAGSLDRGIALFTSICEGDRRGSTCSRYCEGCIDVM